MKIVATAALWFLAVWVAYDMTAFAFGLPRQATPMIALLSALIVGGLLFERSKGSAIAIRSRFADASFRKA